MTLLVEILWRGRNSDHSECRCKFRWCGSLLLLIGARLCHRSVHRTVNVNPAKWEEALGCARYMMGWQRRWRLWLICWNWGWYRTIDWIFISVSLNSWNICYKCCASWILKAVTRIGPWRRMSASKWTRIAIAWAFAMLTWTFVERCIRMPGLHWAIWYKNSAWLWWSRWMRIWSEYISKNDIFMFFFLANHEIRLSLFKGPIRASFKACELNCQQQGTVCFCQHQNPWIRRSNAFLDHLWEFWALMAGYKLSLPKKDHSSRVTVFWRSYPRMRIRCKIMWWIWAQLRWAVAWTQLAVLFKLVGRVSCWSATTILAKSCERRTLIGRMCRS